MATATFRRGLSAVDETMLVQINPTGNYSTANPITVGQVSAPQKYRPCIRFDLTSLPAGAVINSAVLTVKNFGSGGVLGSGQYRAYRLTRDDWTEAGATWDTYDGTNNWTAAGGDATATYEGTASVSSITDDLVFSDMLNMVLEAIANHGSMLNVQLRNQSSNAYLVVIPSNDSTAANRPTLVVDYSVFLPQFIAPTRLFGSGLV